MTSLIHNIENIHCNWLFLVSRQSDISRTPDTFSHTWHFLPFGHLPQYSLSQTCHSLLVQGSCFRCSSQGRIATIIKFFFQIAHLLLAQGGVDRLELGKATGEEVGDRGKGRGRDRVIVSKVANGNSQYMCHNTSSNLAMYKLSTFSNTLTRGTSNYLKHMVCVCSNLVPRSSFWPPLSFCTLQVIKNWTVGKPGN